jgi:hypothetical protein
MARTFYRKQFSNYLGEQRAIDDIVLFFTQDLSPSPTPTPSITPSHTPTSTIPSTPTPTTTQTPTNTQTPTVTNTQTPTNTSSPTPTPTSVICWDSFTISGSGVSALGNGIYQELITYSGGSLSSGWVSGSGEGDFINGTAPDGNDYKVFGSYDGTYYYTYLWNIFSGFENWGCFRTTGNYYVLGGTFVNRINLINSTGSTTPNGVYYYPIAQTYGSFPSYTLTRGSICPTPTPTQTNTPTNTGTPTPTPTKSAFDPDATSYINAILAAGGTLSSPQQTAIDTYFIGLKAQGLYNKFYYLYLFLGGNSGTNALNAVNLGTYNGTFGGTWTHNVSGSTANVGASNYIDTSFAISTSSPSTIETDWSYGCIIRNPLDRATNAYQYAGIGSSPSDYMIVGASLESNNLVQPFYGAGQDITSSNPPLGTCDGYMVSVSRSGSTAWYSASKTAPSLMSDGLLVSSTYTNTYTPPSTTRTIWHNNINGNTAFGQGGTHILAWSATYLSPSQMETFITLTNTLQVSFNTNIFTS